MEKTSGTVKLFIFDGENLLDLNNKLAVTDVRKECEKAMTIYCYAVLRPSVIMQ